MSECSICGKSLVSYYEKSNSKTVDIGGTEYIVCPNCKLKYSDEDELKTVIGNSVRETIKNEENQAEMKNQSESMILTTTPTIEFREISKYIGVIGSEVLAGINIFKDVFASVRNVVGGRSEQLQKTMGQMRKQALEELKEEALKLGADAVVGITIDFDEYAEHMMMLSVSGTAVKTK